MNSIIHLNVIHTCVNRLVTNKNPYTPPPDLRERIDRIAMQHFASTGNDDVMDASFTDNLTKFKVVIT